MRHRRVIAQTTEGMGEAVPTVATFWPHPREVFALVAVPCKRWRFEVGD